MTIFKAAALLLVNYGNPEEPLSVGHFLSGVFEFDTPMRWQRGVVQVRRH